MVTVTGAATVDAVLVKTSSVRRELPVGGNLHRARVPFMRGGRSRRRNEFRNEGSGKSTRRVNSK